LAESKRDIWAEWLLHRRCGGDRDLMNAELALYFHPIRDRILTRAYLSDGDTLLDVGCGDGLVAFGALEKFKTTKVIFSDISKDLLDHDKALARELKVTNRCQFLHASADDLSAVPAESVDAVTTRSVLIYVSDKQKALHEFFRVLKPKGRLSIFEPIKSFGWPEAPHVFNGCDVTPIVNIAAKVKALYRRLQPPETDPMYNFDERDLIAFAESAGFAEIHLELKVEIKPLPDAIPDWKTFVKAAANPKVPTLEEALAQTLTSDEAAQFVAHFRPLVESGEGTIKAAVAQLWARKNQAEC